jgi:hypothetical protein
MVGVVTLEAGKVNPHRLPAAPQRRNAATPQRRNAATPRRAFTGTGKSRRRSSQSIAVSTRERATRGRDEQGLAQVSDQAVEGRVNVQERDEAANSAMQTN